MEDISSNMWPKSWATCVPLGLSTACRSISAPQKFEIKKYALSRKGGSTIVSSPGAEKVNQTMVEPLSRVPARVRGH